MSFSGLGLGRGDGWTPRGRRLRLGSLPPERQRLGPRGKPLCLETSLLNDVDNSRRAEPGSANPKSGMGRTPVGAQPPSPQPAPPRRHGPLPEQEPGVTGAPGRSWLVLHTSSHEDAEEGRFTPHVLLVHFANPQREIFASKPTLTLAVYPSPPFHPSLHSLES